MAGPTTYLRTLRHLRPIQIYGRIWFKLSRPRPDFGEAPPMRVLTGAWTRPAMRAASLEGSGRARFLNVSRDFVECGWDPPEVAKLWRYNLHYFDDLNAIDAEARSSWHRPLVERWIQENPAPAGTGWEPYPTSLRMVNWIKWFLAGAVAKPLWLDSLACQARWLMRRIEWHLLGNHLFANAKALMFAGLFFEGPEADRWLDRGARIVGSQIDEQVLADGGHFERSPMYHDLFLEDLLDLINLLGAALGSRPALFGLAPRLRNAAARMLRWARCMQHPDGRLAMFNDAAHGVAPERSEIERYAMELGLPVPADPADGLVLLAESGYARLSHSGAVALLDVAPVGPDYLPGHAHADTLSFEMSVAGRRLIVNGGTSVYGTGAQRASERATAAHSTVEVAGQNSSEVWGSFRVGRRARPFGLVTEHTSVRCSHDGYRNLSGSPEVRRHWQITDGSLAVTDDVIGGSHDAVARFLVAPGIRLIPAAIGWDAISGAAAVARIRVTHGAAIVTQASYAPEFGTRVPVDCLMVRLQGGRARIEIDWD